MIAGQDGAPTPLGIDDGIGWRLVARDPRLGTALRDQPTLSLGRIAASVTVVTTLPAHRLGRLMPSPCSGKHGVATLAGGASTVGPPGSWIGSIHSPDGLLAWQRARPPGGRSHDIQPRGTR